MEATAEMYSWFYKKYEKDQKYWAVQGIIARKVYKLKNVKKKVSL